jgi:hypothetical protein
LAGGAPFAGRAPFGGLPPFSGGAVALSAAALHDAKPGLPPPGATEPAGAPFAAQPIPLAAAFGCGAGSPGGDPADPRVRGSPLTAGNGSLSTAGNGPLWTDGIGPLSSGPPRPLSTDEEPVSRDDGGAPGTDGNAPLAGADGSPPLTCGKGPLLSDGIGPLGGE